MYIVYTRSTAIQLFFFSLSLSRDGGSDRVCMSTFSALYTRVLELNRSRMIAVSQDVENVELYIYLFIFVACEVFYRSINYLIF